MFKCQCGKLVDSTGRHGLSCKNAKGTNPRHSLANDILCRAMGSAQATSTLEPEGLTGNDGKRPDGMSLASWKHGKCLAWDFTCVDTLADSYLHPFDN